jgi:hypothetical protein
MLKSACTAFYITCILNAEAPFGIAMNCGIAFQYIFTGNSCVAGGRGVLQMAALADRSHSNRCG